MLSAWIFSNDSLSAKGCSGGHCVSVVYVHCGTEHGRPAMVEDPPEDAVVVVVGADTHSRGIIFKSSVVINKLDKAISRTSCIHKNDKSSLVQLAIITIIKRQTSLKWTG